MNRIASFTLHLHLRRAFSMANTHSNSISMASSSFAVVDCASSSLPVTKTYDVFISFRGEDTRCEFTSHLHAALCRNSIETYIDYRIQKGEEVWIELVKAIKESTLFLVVFSENYASSSWCLNELVELMECRKQEEDVGVIPVFYKIDPSQVRKQTGGYHTAFAKHKKDRKVSKEKMQKWKDALFEAANLSGFHSHAYRTETDLIEHIIKAVLQKLNHKYTNDFRGLFLSDENYTNIESLLKIDSKEVRVIGIWGMGGIGKTTLAAAIFQKVSFQYEGTCFLENVAEESTRHGLNYIFNKLLSKLLREDLHIDTPKVIPSIVTRRLRRKKVFIVLDDVNTSQLLENLVGVGRDWLGAGSRVIVTTRDKHVLIGGDVDDIHEVKEMNIQNSLKLFSLNAFSKTYPKTEYEELSKRAIVYAKGIPLALKVLGSFLRSKSENEWDSALSKLKKIPNAEIQTVLRLSYDGLDHDEKNIFLDIACFFKGHERDRVIKILSACNFFPDIGIRSLLDKALIAIANNTIKMHDLIQEMGKEIVREESMKDPGQRSRLWDSEEIDDVLTNNRGTGAIEGIILDMTQITNINLSSKAFGKMSNLRLLAFEVLNGDYKKINSVNLPNNLESLPKSLRYLGWDGYPLKSLPSTFCAEKLVELSMPYSNVEKLWNGPQNLPNLEMVDLSESSLIEFPNLCGAPNLKYGIFSHCKSLSCVDSSIFSLPKIETLNVSGCTSLESLSCSSPCSPSLQTISATDCFNLQEFSVTFMPSDRPHYLNLGRSGLNELPSSILHIRNFGNLTFPISDGLMNLPEDFAYQITLTDSRKHERDALITLRKVFPYSGFRSVRRLFFMNCRSLRELPDNISLLSSLEYLRLISSAVISLPESIKHLPRLKYLEVIGCAKLRSIPAIPRSIQCFHVWQCESVETMLSSTSEPSRKPKCTFLLPNCTKLDQHSYHAILKYAIERIDLGANEEEDEDDASSDHDDDAKLYTLKTVKSGKICYFLPAINSNVQDWFHYISTQASVTVELPPNLLAFAFYLVLSQDQSRFFGSRGCFGCECSLETCWGERINVTSFFVDEVALLNPYHLFELKSDHVFLWFDAQCCKQIMEAIKERKASNHRSTNYNPKLTFKFFALTLDDEEAAIKECGFHWIYPLEGGSKRSREIHELGASAVPNRVDGSETDEQQEIVPKPKKMKQCVFGTPSNLEAEETEELRLLLEELLHIGFGGDLM